MGSQSGKISRAFIVVGQLEGFVNEGDSGYWGLDEHGLLRIIGFAGEHNGRTSCAIPASWVFEDIFARTGAEVIDPSMDKGNEK